MSLVIDTDGFTWDDFISGDLHIDHIIPLCAFNFSSERDHDFSRAWSLKNLQLLPAKENLLKAGRVPLGFQPLLI